MKTILIVLVALLAAGGAVNATAAEGAAIPQGARLAGTCAACHGTNGATKGDTKGDTLPPLAGQSKDTLAAALHDFKSGKRQATIMTQIAKGYTDQQIEQLATWFAAQKP